MAATESQTLALAAKLASVAGVPLIEVKYPSNAEDWNTGEPVPPESPFDWTPPPGYWSIEHPPSSSPLLLRFTSRDEVAGLVPGDGVWLHQNGSPHSAGRITSMTERYGVIRVIVEDLRSIGES